MTTADQLKAMRNRLGLSMREVDEASRRIAEKRGNSEYIISTAWLTQIENSDSTPSIYKLFTLSIVYRVRFTDLLGMYGIDLESIKQLQASNPLHCTHITDTAVYNPERAIQFPVRFDRGFRFEKTNLLARMVELWGEIPVGILQHMDLRKYNYGYIGTKDFTLTRCCGPVRWCRLTIRRHASRILLGKRSSTDPSISSSCETSTSVPGASCTASSYSSSRIRSRAVRSASIRIRMRRRS